MSYYLRHINDPEWIKKREGLPLKPKPQAFYCAPSEGGISFTKQAEDLVTLEEMDAYRMRVHLNDRGCKPGLCRVSEAALARAELVPIYKHGGDTHPRPELHYETTCLHTRNGKDPHPDVLTALLVLVNDAEKNGQILAYFKPDPPLAECLAV